MKSIILLDTRGHIYLNAFCSLRAARLYDCQRRGEMKGEGKRNRDKKKTEGQSPTNRIEAGVLIQLIQYRIHHIKTVWCEFVRELWNYAQRRRRRRRKRWMREKKQQNKRKIKNQIGNFQLEKNNFWCWPLCSTQKYFVKSGVNTNTRTTRTL